jgi:hypothetical protein
MVRERKEGVISSSKRSPEILNQIRKRTISGVWLIIKKKTGPLESPPPPYSPPPNQSIAQNLASSTPIRTRSPPTISSPPIRTPPTLQTSNLSTTPLNLAEYASPASAITVISPFSHRNRNEPPPNFPPPPGAASSSRDRSASRSRFTLSSLTSRGKSTERSNTAKAISTLHQNTRDALAFAPTSWGGRNSPQPEP